MRVVAALLALLLSGCGTIISPAPAAPAPVTSDTATTDPLAPR